MGSSIRRPQPVQKVAVIGLAAAQTPQAARSTPPASSPYSF
jgi:hypothetical protein